MTIVEWFSNGAPYDIGVKLYGEFGNNTTLLSAFQKGPNSYNIQKLHYELKKLEHLSPAGHDLPIITINANEAFKTINDLSESFSEVKKLLDEAKEDLDITTDELNEVSYELEEAQAELEKAKSKGIPIENEQYIELDKSWKAYYKEANYLQQQLDNIDSEEEIEKTSFRILELIGFCKPIWKKLDYYREHGKFPEEPKAPAPPELEDPVAIMKRIRNLASYISKYQDKDERKTDVEAWRQEKAILEEKIKQ